MEKINLPLTKEEFQNIVLNALVDIKADIAALRIMDANYLKLTSGEGSEKAKVEFQERYNSLRHEAIIKMLGGKVFPNP